MSNAPHLLTPQELSQLYKQLEEEVSELKKQSKVITEKAYKLLDKTEADSILKKLQQLHD